MEKKPHSFPFQRIKCYKPNFLSRILCPREAEICLEVSVAAQLSDGNSLSHHRGWTSFSHQCCWGRLKKSVSHPDEKRFGMPQWDNLEDAQALCQADGQSSTIQTFLTQHEVLRPGWKTSREQREDNLSVLPREPDETFYHFCVCSKQRTYKYLC